MNRTFALAATLAAGVAMAPMAADAAKLTIIDVTADNETYTTENGAPLTFTPLGGTTNFSLASATGVITGPTNLPSMGLINAAVKREGPTDPAQIRFIFEESGFNFSAPFSLDVGGTISSNPDGSVTGQVDEIEFFANGDSIGSFGAFNTTNWSAGTLSALTAGSDLKIVVDATLFNSGGFELTTATMSAVPVPAALPLMLTALAGLGLIGRRKMKAAA